MLLSPSVNHPTDLESKRLPSMEHLTIPFLPRILQLIVRRIQNWQIFSYLPLLFLLLPLPHTPSPSSSSSYPFYLFLLPFLPLPLTLSTSSSYPFSLFLLPLLPLLFTRSPSSFYSFSLFLLPVLPIPLTPPPIPLIRSPSSFYPFSLFFLPFLPLLRPSNMPPEPSEHSKLTACQVCVGGCPSYSQMQFQLQWLRPVTKHPFILSHTILQDCVPGKRKQGRSRTNWASNTNVLDFFCCAVFWLPQSNRSKDH